MYGSSAIFMSSPACFGWGRFAEWPFGGYFDVGKWKLASLACSLRGQRAVTTLARV